MLQAIQRVEHRLEINPKLIKTSGHVEVTFDRGGWTIRVPVTLRKSDGSQDKRKRPTKCYGFGETLQDALIDIFKDIELKTSYTSLV